MVDALVLQSKYASSQYKWPAIQHMNYSKKSTQIHAGALQKEGSNTLKWTRARQLYHDGNRNLYIKLQGVEVESSSTEETLFHSRDSSAIPNKSEIFKVRNENSHQTSSPASEIWQVDIYKKIKHRNE